MVTSSLGLIERVLNGLVAADPELTRQVANIRDAVVLFDCTRPEVALAATVDGATLKLSAVPPREPDVTISGTVGEYLTLLKAKRRGQPTPSGVVRISGDLAVAEQIQNLAGSLDIDWETVLAGYLGDVPTHHLSRTARGARAYLLARMRDLSLDVSEYLRFEAQLLPTAEDLAAFGSDVTELRAAVDRFEARLERLERQEDEQT